MAMHINSAAKTFAAALGVLLLTACATPSSVKASGGRVGSASPVPGLGAPTMIATSLGRLAVWDSGPPVTEQGGAATLALWPSIFSDHSIYSALVDRWRGKRRLILIDGPGHGSSDGVANRTFTMDECAQAMKAVFDALSVSEAVVGGTSWGGLVAGEFALRYPQHTRGVIMMNTPFFMAPDGPSVAEKMITWASGNVLSTQLFTSGVARSFFLPKTRYEHGPVIAQFHAGLQQSDPATLSNAIRSVLLERKPLADRLSSITAPTLVIAGLHDAMYPLNRQRSAAATLPRGRIEVVDSAHISVVDQPIRVAELIEAFLSRDVLEETQ